MKRIIIDHRKLTPGLAARLLECYPEGYGDEDLIAFKNSRGEWVEAVQLQTEEALYLIKINKKLSDLLASLDLEDPTEEGPEHTALGSIENEYDGSLEGELNLEE
ncbi:MAG: hypothetical protein P8X60_04970 [Robiginitalea sp.]|jgi:hypothetical protein